ncbi:MAG: hypothetical protein ICV67_02245 [Thermoleophilia bacterium]|nr:hypothetical protein [Thermoleophilia bacterium]
MAEGYRETSLASWESSAAGWAYWARWLSEASAEVNEWLLGRLALRDGDTILELAAGWGVDYPSIDGYWDFVTRGAGAVTPVLSAMSSEALVDFERELAERSAPFLRPDGSLAFPASALAVAATA